MIKEFKVKDRVVLVTIFSHEHWRKGEVIQTEKIEITEYDENVVIKWTYIIKLDSTNLNTNYVSSNNYIKVTSENLMLEKDYLQKYS